MKEKDRFILKEYLNSEELVDKRVKTTTLNIIKEKLINIESRITPRNALYGALETLIKLVEDAYIISMYRFQFKIFTISINKEIEILEKAINAQSN